MRALARLAGVWSTPSPAIGRSLVATRMESASLREAEASPHASVGLGLGLGLGMGMGMGMGRFLTETDIF